MNQLASATVLSSTYIIHSNATIFQTSIKFKIQWNAGIKRPPTVQAKVVL